MKGIFVSFLYLWIVCGEFWKESEEIYRSFVQNFQGIAVRSHLDWSPVFFHGSVEKITGYTERELLSQNPDWMNIIHPDDSKIILENYPVNVFSKPDFTAERSYRIIRKNGEIRWVHDVLHTQCDENGSPIYINTAVFDITESKQTEEEHYSISHQTLFVLPVWTAFFWKSTPLSTPIWVIRIQSWNPVPSMIL